MKFVSALLFLGILSGSLGLAAQEKTPPSPAQTPVQTPIETPAAAPAQVPAPGAASPSAPGIVPDAAPQAAAADATPPAQVVPAGVDPNYILGTDDVIHVDVWREQALTSSVVIRPDGRISMPLVGDLVAAGLTPMALATQITEHLKHFINEPSVTVTVTAFNSRRIFFIGEVQHPGPLPLTRDMSMLQAISAAGGLTPYANKKKIYILRGASGKQQKLPFNYSKALKDGNPQGITLAAGDTVVVP